MITIPHHDSIIINADVDILRGVLIIYFLPQITQIFTE